MTGSAPLSPAADPPEHDPQVLAERVGEQVGRRVRRPTIFGLPAPSVLIAPCSILGSWMSRLSPPCRLRGAAPLSALPVRARLPVVIQWTAEAVS